MSERAIYEERADLPFLSVVPSPEKSPQLLEQNAEQLLRYLLDEPRLRVAALSQTAAEGYFEEVVAPAIEASLYSRNEGLSRQQSAERVEGMIFARTETLRAYVRGESVADIAEQTGKSSKNSVQNSIFDTVQLVLGEIDNGPEYFKAQLLERTPGIEFGLQPSKEERQRAGATAIRGSAAARVSGPRSFEGRDSIGLYLDEIARTPLLDAAGEVELAKRIEAGLYAGQLLAQGRAGHEGGGESQSANEEELEWLAEDGSKAVDAFINANLRLVVSIARKYGWSKMPMLDLIQEGNTGLIRAVEKFDYTRGIKFSTYSTWWVKQAIQRGIANQARVVRVPVHVQEEMGKVARTRRNLEHQLGREPDPEDIAAELGMELDRVTDLIAWGREHISLDTPLDEDGDTSLGDLVAKETTPGPDVLTIDNESRERLAALVDQLDDRNAYIIRARYGLLDGRQHKLADVGAKVGVSAERVRQLEREALRRLRRLGDPDLAS